MHRARTHLIDRDLVSIPDDERIDVIETPDYLRNVIPFAAYFSPAAFDRDSKGIYVVTPSVHGDPNAMREHNRASISNTSIHEAYPGHHLQLDVARRHPSLTRLMADAPEFVEGWGMYSELMMREQGFDDAPEYRVMLHTDAIWRACRIILDVRLHRGELTVAEGVDFLVEQTRFERDNARSEVEWYTYRPTYPLSYLLGRTLLLELRAGEQRRLGDAFSLRDFHDTLMRNGSLPISFHRRLLGVRAADACWSSHRSTSRAGAPGSCTGPALPPASARRPIVPIASSSGSSPRAPGSSTSSTSTGREPGRPRTSRWSAPSHRARPSRCSSPAASTPPKRSSWPSPRVPRAWC